MSIADEPLRRLTSDQSFLTRETSSLSYPLLLVFGKLWEEIADYQGEMSKYCSSDGFMGAYEVGCGGVELVKRCGKSEDPLSASVICLFHCVLEKDDNSILSCLK